MSGCLGYKPASLKVAVRWDRLYYKGSFSIRVEGTPLGSTVYSHYITGDLTAKCGPLSFVL